MGRKKTQQAQKLERSGQCSRQGQLLVADGHHQVNGHRNPNLCLHRVGDRAVGGHEAQVTFDPAKEQFDLPAQPVNPGCVQRRDFEMIGQDAPVASVYTAAGEKATRASLSSHGDGAAPLLSVGRLVFWV
jgi:hypothetical protein